MRARLCNIRPFGIVDGLKTPDPAIAAQHKKLRSAMTLIEVLVVVVLSSLVMSVMISFTVALQRSDRHMRSFAVRIERLGELAETLRYDLRQAEEASLREANQLAISLGGGGEIRYELADRGCLRVATAEGNSPQAREFFAVGPAEKWQLESDTGGRRPLAMITLHFTKGDKESESRPAPLVVYAALGADLRQIVAPMPHSNGIESEQKQEVEQEVTEEAEEF